MKRKIQSHLFSLSHAPNNNLSCCLNVQAHYKGFSMSVKNDHNFHHTNLNEIAQEIVQWKVFLLHSNKNCRKQQFIKFPVRPEQLESCVSVNDSFGGGERNFATCNTAIFPFECRNYFSASSRNFHFSFTTTFHHFYFNGDVSLSCSPSLFSAPTTEGEKKMLPW